MDKADEENVLRQKSVEVKEITPAIIKLLDNLADTLRSARGVGLAAPQIGVTKRVIVVDTGEGLIELINPEIMEMHGKQVDNEGCLSAPGLYCEVPRAYRVRIKGLDREGREVGYRAEGFAARAFQHEVDHLDGILAVDRITDIRTLCTREEFEKRYRAGSPYAVKEVAKIRD